MSSYIVSDSQLNSLCVFLKNNSSYYYSYVNHYFELMYLTGCRANEAVNYRLWHPSGDLVINLLPLKFNNQREFLINYINCFLIDNLIASNFSVFSVNYSKINYHILNQIRYYKITIGDKSSSCHLFRHNFAKQLKLAGKSDLEIKHILGERNQSSANSYIYSVIKSEHLLPF